MNSNRAIFWATLVFVNMHSATNTEGPMKWVCVAAFALSLLMLYGTTRDKKDKDV